jgi:hypothetical protein
MEIDVVHQIDTEAVAFTIPGALASAIIAARSRLCAAGGSLKMAVMFDMHETMWTPRMPGVRRTCIEYTPRLRLSMPDRDRYIGVVYFDNRFGSRFVHPDAIARAAAWVLGETDVDTDDPRSDAEIAAAAAAENQSEF